MMVSGARTDYLPRVGPPPLRFEDSHAANVAAVALPPLDPPEPIVTNNMVIPPSPPQPAVAPRTPTNTPPAQAEVAGPAANNPPAPLPPGPPNPMGGGPNSGAPMGGPGLTPQMFVPFFSPQPGGTNGPGGINAAVVVPPDFFRPPTPGPAASSTVSYSTP